MKYKLTVYVNKRLVEIAKASQMNLSAICEKALEKATGFQDPEALAARILALKAEIKVLTYGIEERHAVEVRLPEMIAMYEKRHLRTNSESLTRRSPTEDQDMTWIRATKARYGLQGMRDKELYGKLKEGMA